MSGNSKEDDHEGGGAPPKTFDWMPAGCEPLADGEYDAIIMGTGLTECIVSGLLSVKGLRVLQVDRNNYYGGDTASLGLQNLYQTFRPEKPDVPATLGHSRDWNVDLVPKFIMACGSLVKILLHCKVTRYLDFKSIDASYVFKDNKVQKVPSSPQEALASELMGFFEKRKFRNFLIFINDYDKDKPATWMKGKPMDKWAMKDVYYEYGLDENTQSFIGHAMALMRDDDYLNQPAQSTVEAIQLYCYSIERYGKSPYIYPLYGLGTMPEGFSRLAAVNGGTFMLNTAVDSVLETDGKAWGIRSGNAVAKAKYIIGDQSYFTPSKSRVTGQVVRSICILDHPIAGVTTSEGTTAESVQIIIPARQVGRRNDIYVCMVSSAHSVSSAGKYIAIVSTTVETKNPIAELEAGIKLLGRIVERFDKVSDLRAPVSSGKQDNCYISQSYDATSHFETAANDVLDLYYRITGEHLDMNISADSTQEDE